jgi:hypothetical protein
VKLVAKADRPWAEFGRMQRPITAMRLASLLKDYKIKPGTIRIGAGEKDTAKGYKWSRFGDVFQRFLPTPSTDPSHRHNTMKSIDSKKINPSHRSPGVTTQNAQNASSINECDGVTASSVEPWETEL